MASNKIDNRDASEVALKCWRTRGVSLLSWCLGLLDYGFLLLQLLGPVRPRFFSGGYGAMDAYERLLHSRKSFAWNKLLENKEEENDNNNKGESSCTVLSLTDDKIDWGAVRRESNVTIQDGRFLSPISQELPKEAAYCQFCIVRPFKSYQSHEHAECNKDNNDKHDDVTVCIIMLPATGETNNKVRLGMARQLAAEYGWCSIILTAPYYGERKPKNQTLFFLNTVTDIVLQAEGIIREAATLSAYILAKSSRTKVCFTGFSFGAAMSGCAAACALQAGVDGRRLACAAYVGSASPNVLADGLLESAIHWESLMMQRHTSTNNKKQNISPKEETRQELFQELNKVQLDNFVTDKENKLAIVKAFSMEYDRFIKPKYALDFESQMQKCLSSTPFRIEWQPGGHAFAALARPFLHKRFLVDTIREFEQLD